MVVSGTNQLGLNPRLVDEAHVVGQWFLVKAALCYLNSSLFVGVLLPSNMDHGEVLTCDSARSWRLHSAASLGMTRTPVQRPNIPHSHIILTMC